MNPGLSLKQYARFILSVTFLHVFTYFLVGSLAYFLVYDAVIEAGGFDQFMRNPNNPEEWQHVEIWVMPAELLRGVLFGLAFSPFLQTLAGWGFGKRVSVLILLLIVLSVFNATMPASGSIEGWVYLRPGSNPELPDPLLGYVEVPLQLALFSCLVSYRIGKIVSLKPL